MTNKSPATLLHNSMAQSAKLAGRARRALESTLKSIEKELRDPSVQPGRKLELTDALIGVMTALDRSAESCGRLLTQKHSPPITTDDSMTSERILAELTNGKTRVG